MFEFIESRWGKEGLRQFLFSLRKSVIGGGEDAYEEALKLKPEEFDQEFEKYLKNRFKPFRDKERPADYGKNLAPNPMKTRFANVYSIEPSPSGDLIAVMTGNRRDQELDIVLLSAKDGSVIKNLTSGFDQDKGFEYISTPGSRWDSVPWMTWSPVGDRLAYFARTEKRKSLIVQNVISGAIEQKITMDVDEPESPCWSPDGKTIAFSALRGAVGDLFAVDVASHQVTDLTNDAFADYAPTYAPDGKSIVYLARISGDEKLFRLDLATRAKTQLTFGTHDDASAKFIDADTLVFSSTATNPAVPIEPEVAKNGNIYNIWTLNLKTGELRQYTDAVGGNVSAAVLPGDKGPRIAFVSYYKGEYALNTLERKDPIQTAASSDFGAPGLVTDFQAPLSHTLVAENKRKKGTFEKMFLEGRPPVNVGVTSGGDIFGGTQVTFTDVLGDKQFNVFAASISQYRTIAGSYTNLSRRFNYALQGFSNTTFFYGTANGVFYDPSLSGYIDRDLATATRTIQGGSAFGIWPFDRYRRVEVFGQGLQLQRRVRGPGTAAVLRSVPAIDLRDDALPERHVGAAQCRLRAGDDRVPRVRAAQGQHDAHGLHRVTEDRQHAVEPDGGRRRALLHAARRLRRAGAPRARVPQLGPGARLHLLRRQLRDARVRLPAVRGAEHRASGTPNCASR